MITPDRALRLVGEHARPRRARRVELAAACGLQLAETICTETDSPAFDRAMMDGYAVQTCDAGRTVRVVGEVPAGVSSDAIVTRGTCVEIMTGAVCPQGAEAVVPKELVQRNDDHIALPENLKKGRHIAALGSESRAGTVVLESGNTMTPLAVAVAASVGRREVDVIPRPTVAVITTGRELVPTDAKPEPGQIYDSNGPMLLALLHAMGIEDVSCEHVGDQETLILESLERAAQCDLILLSGGVSVGNYDLVPDCLSRYGAEIVFHKVSQKPGKPLLFATKRDQLLFGLPGNPLSCHLCFHRYGAAAIRGMQGKIVEPPTFLGVLTGDISPECDRTRFVPGRAVYENQQWLLSPLPSVSSADIFGTSQANCYIEVPPEELPPRRGQPLRFSWIGPASCFH